MKNYQTCIKSVVKNSYTHETSHENFSKMLLNLNDLFILGVRNIKWKKFSLSTLHSELRQQLSTSSKKKHISGY